jgi:hypothetical protein
MSTEREQEVSDQPDAPPFLERLDIIFDYIQEILSCHHISSNPHYQSPKGIGKIGLVGYLIGFVNGSAFTFLLCCIIFGIKTSIYDGLVSVFSMFR